uniref:Uncharacterized protein n=1 Tax=Panagrolaimus sp. JU765 TaxID=591449 RepID=A0AC34QT48_9BILA
MQRRNDDDVGQSRVGFRRHTSPHQTLEKLDRREHEEDLTPRQIAGIHGMRARVKHQLEEEGRGDHNDDYSDEENNIPKKSRVSKRSDVNIPADDLQKLHERILELEKLIRGDRRKRGHEHEDDYEDENYNRRGRRTTNQHVDPRETLRKLDRKEHEEDLSAPQILGIHGKRAQVMNQLRGGGGNRRGAGGDDDYDDYDEEDNTRRGRRITNQRVDPRETLRKLDRKEREEDLSAPQILGIHGKRAQVMKQLHGGQYEDEDDDGGNNAPRGRGINRRQKQSYDDQDDYEDDGHQDHVGRGRSR